MKYFTDEQLNNRFDDLVSGVALGLNEGNRQFESAYGDKERYGLALRSYHGALENQFRVNLIKIVPVNLKADILDVKKTNWDSLLALGKEYLGVSEHTRGLIKQANHYRNSFIHQPYRFEWNNTNEFINYVDFVKNWCSNTPTVPMASPRLPAIEPYSEDIKKPWYRSSCIMVTTFLFFFPIWALLTITDKDKGVGIKIFAFMYISLWIAFTVYLSMNL